MPNLAYLLFRRLRGPLVALVLVYAILVLGFVLIPGMDDQGNPWRMDFFHAFYFVSFMGTTIGFGEIPYAFTEMQRMWALIGMYASVTTWLFGVGALLTTIQGPAFRYLLADHSFRRKIDGIHEPFYIICGYGDTGRLLVEALAEEGIRTVVIDSHQESIDSLLVSDLPLHVPALCADASLQDSLEKAGIQHPNCEGIVVISNSDEVNLTITLSAHLIVPDLHVIVRAESKDAQANISSFGANVVINPFETFAGRLALALHAPGMYVLFEWMTGVPHEVLREPVFPPAGKWILCGYGRFGHAVNEKLITAGIATTIVEATPENVAAPHNVIKGRGTEASTLKDAGILSATGIVSGTDDDANNLSIILTARELNKDLFTVARQNRQQNEALFRAADLDLLMQRGSVIAHKIYAFIRTPLLNDFLYRAQQHDNDWANTLVSRISGVVTEEVPHIWQLEVGSKTTPAFHGACQHGSILLRDLRRDPRNREQYLAAVPLLLKRGDEEKLLPMDDTEIKSGDQLLFCGRIEADRQMEWSTGNCDVLAYVLTGEEHPSTYLGKWLRRKHNKLAKSYG